MQGAISFKRLFTNDTSGGSRPKGKYIMLIVTTFVSLAVGGPGTLVSCRLCNY